MWGRGGWAVVGRGFRKLQIRSSGPKVPNTLSTLHHSKQTKFCLLTKHPKVYKRNELSSNLSICTKNFKSQLGIFKRLGVILWKAAPCHTNIQPHLYKKIARCSRFVHRCTATTGRTSHTDLESTESKSDFPVTRAAQPGCHRGCHYQMTPRTSHNFRLTVWPYITMYFRIKIYTIYFKSIW